jgi:hypothetical protein
VSLISLLLSAAFSDDNTDYRGRRYDPIVTGVQNPRTTGVKSPQYRFGRDKFRLGTLSLYRQELTARPEQPRRPADQLVQWCHRPGGSHIRVNFAGEILGPSPDNPDIRQPQMPYALVEEHASP